MKNNWIITYMLTALVVLVFTDVNCEELHIEPLTIVVSNSSPVISKNDMPMGQTPGSDTPSLLPEDEVLDTDSEIFGLEGGYFHPYISIQGEYTDNLYNVNQDKTSNVLTTITPGVWLAIPRKRDIPIAIATNNSSPGGLQEQLKDYEGTDRYQAYMGGGLDFLFYSEDSDLNETDGLLEGMFRYNLKSGLSLQILDHYSHSQDIFDVGTVARNSVGRFDSNILMLTADWVFTEKTRVKVDYSNFWLEYDEDIDSFLNRTDNALELYGYYIYSEKTSFFLEYKFVDVAYDVATINDNTQNFYYGGITWNTTEKLSLMAKAGFQDKSFEKSGNGLEERDDTDSFVYNIQATYRFTEKTNIAINLFKQNEESDSTLASNKEVIGLGLNYSQELTRKIIFKFDFGFQQEDYDQLIAQDRKEDVFQIRPSASYLFREWLKGEVAYEYRTRDSTDDLFDYDTNTFILNLSLAL